MCWTSGGRLIMTRCMAPRFAFPPRPVVLAAVASLMLAACASGGGNPSPSAVANATPDSRGVITYATYQVGVAREGDTLTTLAARVGTNAAELSKLNGLPVDYRLRAGEVVVLPESVARPAPGAAGGWSPDMAAAAIEGAPAGAAQAPNPFQNGQKDPLIDPVRHRVEPGETVYSIARLYGVSVTALASWNGLGPDMAIRVNQELLIPLVGAANRITTSADTQPGQTTAVAPPPIAAEPLPENISPGANPASPNLAQHRTPPGGRLQAPVAASVSRPFSAANPSGVGFSAAVGAPVRAAASGEVALISEEMGGKGAIVMISHTDDLITTYSVLTDVTVKKGARVSAGQVIGKVAPRDPQEFQFDVFRGLDPMDPATYIGG